MGRFLALVGGMSGALLIRASFKSGSVLWVVMGGILFAVSILVLLVLTLRKP